MNTRDWIASHYRHIKGLTIVQSWGVVEGMEKSEGEEVYSMLQEPQSNHSQETMATLLLIAERYLPIETGTE